ncbi:rho/rac/cdc gtpase-activating protein [Anaeramoeba flamelloides]|uniref:Rho/rac/cdc gtpase-activating protein n=1 Tax=Anaeramoeba flamelloides TaxID=1746091 RepID=A0AAV8ABI6_9EUKA|nr:rho/rac/cdc gtpase-activating protein [Anaeramoeba flamelloides]
MSNIKKKPKPIPRKGNKPTPIKRTGNKPKPIPRKGNKPTPIPRMGNKPKPKPIQRTNKLNETNKTNVQNEKIGTNPNKQPPIPKRRTKLNLTESTNKPKVIPKTINNQSNKNTQTKENTKTNNTTTTTTTTTTTATKAPPKIMKRTVKLDQKDLETATTSQNKGNISEKDKYKVGIQNTSNGTTQQVETKVVKDIDSLFGGNKSKEESKSKWKLRKSHKNNDGKGKKDKEKEKGNDGKKKLKKLFKKGKKNKQKEVKNIEETRIFGVPLQVAIQREGRNESSPPSIVEKSIMYLEEHGVDQEGIYRLSGSMLQMGELKEKFNRGEKVNLETVRDENTVGSLMKLYFRELPEPILTEKYTPRLPKLSKLDQETQKKRLIHVYNNIPEVNRAVLRWLFPHLYRVSLHAETNKMTPQNLAIVFAPTLHIPLALMVFMINNWMDILCDDENERIQKEKRQLEGLEPDWVEDSTNQTSTQTSVENKTEIINENN